MEVCLDSELGFLQGKAQISMAVLVGTDESETRFSASSSAPPLEKPK